MRRASMWLLAALLACITPWAGSTICPDALQRRDRIAGDIVDLPIPETTQGPYNFQVKLRLGPLDRFPYTDDVFEVGCGDRDVTVETDEAILSTFTLQCRYPGGQGSVSQFVDRGCDTWVDLAWNDPHAGARNYTVLSLNAKGEPLWVAHSVPDARTAMDITNCYATSQIECGLRHPRHQCIWQDANIQFTGTTRGHGRCVGRNAQQGYLDLNYHGPLDMNAQVGPQGTVATSPSADIYYAGILKDHSASGLQTQGKDRITFLLLVNEVWDHPPSPWLPDPSNLGLSYSRQFIKPVGAAWYWAYGTDRGGRKYSPYACTIVPSRAVWGKPVDISFSCTHCRAALLGATGSEPLLSSDMIPSRAWDGVPSTGYAAWEPSGGYTTAELDIASPVSLIRFRPLPGQESAMHLGRFVGITSQAGPEIPLATIAVVPKASPAWTELAVPSAAQAQKLKFITYYGTSGSHSRVADIEIFYPCSGEHSVESDSVKAVKAGEGCAGAAAYGTEAGRTDLECMWRGSSECFAFEELCVWDAAGSACRQKIPRSRKTFTFNGAGDAEVHFCYEGSVLPMPLTLSDTPPPAPPATPPPSGGATPPPAATPTPTLPRAGYTPYPGSTPSPPTAEPTAAAPTNAPLAPPPTPTPPAPPGTAAPPQPTLAPGEAPPPPFLTEADLTLIPGGGGGGGGAASASYRYLEEGVWVCVSGVPCRTVVLSPLSPGTALSRRAAGPGLGILPELEARCALLSPFGAYAETPFGQHAFSSQLSGGSAPLRGGRAVLTDMTLTMQASRRSGFSMSCVLHALHPSTGATLIRGPPLSRRLLIDTVSSSGASLLLGVGGGAPLRVTEMRLGMAEGDVDTSGIESAVARALGIPAGLVHVALPSPRGVGVVVQQAATSSSPPELRGCIEDPSLIRSTLVWLLLRGVVSPPDTEVSLLRQLLPLLADPTSPLSRELCGVLEAHASLPTEAQAGVFSTGATSSSPQNQPALIPVGASTPPGTADGDGGGGDAGPALLIVLIVLLVISAACIVAGCCLYRARRKRKREEEAGQARGGPQQGAEGKAGAWEGEGEEDEEEEDDEVEVVGGGVGGAASPARNPILRAFRPAGGKGEVIEVED